MHLRRYDSFRLSVNDPFLVVRHSGRPAPLTRVRPVADVQNALLCNAAEVDPRGLVSMLGAFVDQISGAELPVRGQLWLVARLVLGAADDGGHAFVVEVVGEGGEPVTRLDGSFQGPPPSGNSDPDLPQGGNLVMPLTLEFRRAGLYEVRLLLDGEPRAELPLRVRLTTPAG